MLERKCLCVKGCVCVCVKGSVCAFMGVGVLARVYVCVRERGVCAFRGVGFFTRVCVCIQWRLYVVLCCPALCCWCFMSCVIGASFHHPRSEGKPVGRAAWTPLRGCRHTGVIFTMGFVKSLQNKMYHRCDLTYDLCRHTAVSPKQLKAASRAACL